MLGGIKIIELEGLGPGPFCGMLLADLGAEVTVIHRPQVADTPGAVDENLLDRGKRSIVLDLKDTDDRALALQLIAQADALIEGYRPGVAERLGLGPADCHAVNPRLVYGRMTGWGQTGPLAKVAGHDLNYISRSGALWYASAPGDAPVSPPTLVGDIGGGAMYLAVGILSGVLNARSTGKGTVVDAAIVDGSAHMMALIHSMRPAGNFVTKRGASVLDGPHWNRSYLCADGGWVSVQALEPKFYALFLDKLGLGQDQAMIAGHYDRAAWGPLTERLKPVFAAKPRAYWDQLFGDSDACVAPVLSPEDALNDPHIAARDIWDPGTLAPAPAPRFDGERRIPGPIPARGQHSQQIRDEVAAK